MKCPHCPKEIKEDNQYTKYIGTGEDRKEYISNPDFDKHIKRHINKTK